MATITDSQLHNAIIVGVLCLFLLIALAFYIVDEIKSEDDNNDE